MLTARRTFAATTTVALLAAAGAAAAVAADPAPNPPPRIAFLANGHVPADALAAGPIAGQLGAPMYTTARGDLVDATRSALKGYDPELVIVLGGTVAISDEVVEEVEDATGLAYTDVATPDGGVVRAAGGDRFSTAAAVARLLAAYDPAFLPVGAAAVDADTLDGRDSSAFLPADGKAADAAHADTATRADDAASLDGRDASTFAGSDELPTVWVHQPASSTSLQSLSEVDVAEVMFTAPADGMVNVDSSIYVKQRGTSPVAVTLGLANEGAPLGNVAEMLTDDGGGGSVLSIAYPRTMQVRAGQDYTVTLELQAVTGSDPDLWIDEQRLAVTFFPASRTSFDDTDV